MKLIISISSVASIFLLFLIIGHLSSKDRDERAEEALEYCKKNGYSTEYCLLVDYGRHSGRARFFLWDFNVNGNEKCTDFGNWECTDFGNNNAPISVTTIHNFR